MSSHRPTESEYSPFYTGYVALVPETGIVAVLEAQVTQIRELASVVPPQLETHRYAPGKWSIRELLGHLVDAERVFGYRAFCISRGESADLPGFDENAYVARGDSDARTLTELVEELVLLRQGNLALFRRLDPARWLMTGNANGATVSVRALAYILAGHLQHHLQVLQERYGVGSRS